MRKLTNIEVRLYEATFHKTFINIFMNNKNSRFNDRVKKISARRKIKLLGMRIDSTFLINIRRTNETEEEKK